jgi:hypothetical protein
MRAFGATAAVVCLALLSSDRGMPQTLSAPALVAGIAPRLEPPAGDVVRVSTEPQLQVAVANLSSGQTILIAPGTYKLTKTLSVGGRPLNNVAIRGAGDRREDVTLVGTGMATRNVDAAPFGIWTGNGVNRLLVANMTIRDFAFHPLIFNTGTQAPHVYNVALIDGGEQLLKSNPDPRGHGVDDAIVEYSLFAYSSTSRDTYTNAIDVHGGANWIIRHNWFVNIRAPRGELAGPAILLWRGSSAATVDSNTFVNCQREISLGLEPTAADTRAGGGIVKNNMIARDRSVRGDAAILVAAWPRVQVAHNTVLAGHTYANAIEYRFASTRDVLIENNLTDGEIAARDGAHGTVQHNVTSADVAMFVNPARGDLHLLPTARGAVGGGQWIAAAPVDWDGQTRSQSRPDIGADEWSAP